MAAKGPEVITDYAATPLYESITPDKAAVDKANRAFNTPTSARFAVIHGEPSTPPPDAPKPTPQDDVTLLLIGLGCGVVLGGCIVFLVLSR
jgi:hypothetical protein